MTTLKIPPCALEKNEETIAVLPNGTRLVPQKNPYTEGGMIAVSPEHRSTLCPEDVEMSIYLMRALPNRVAWYSSPGAGASQSHMHIQLHLKEWFGGVLPIEQAGRQGLFPISQEVQVRQIVGYPLSGLSFTTSDDPHFAARVACLSASELHGPYNLLLPNGREIIVVGRSKEIPDGWTKKFGGAEVMGVFIFQKPPTKSRTSYEQLWAALANIGLPQPEQNAWEARVVQRLAQPGTERKKDSHVRPGVPDIDGVLTPAGANASRDWVHQSL